MNAEEINKTPQPVYSPVGKVNLSFTKFILLSLITFGLYGVYVYAKMGDILNLAATRYDGKRTMSYWLVFFLVSPLTLGIGGLVWQHKFCARLGAELERRKLSAKIGAGTFWLWGVLGCLIVVGPLVYTYKLIHAVNDLARSAAND